MEDAGLKVERKVKLLSHVQLFATPWSVALGSSIHGRTEVLKPSINSQSFQLRTVSQKRRGGGSAHHHMALSWNSPLSSYIFLGCREQRFMRRNVEKKRPEDPALQREAPSLTPERLELRAAMHIKPGGILWAQECCCRKVHCQTLPCLIRDPGHGWERGKPGGSLQAPAQSAQAQGCDMPWCHTQL